MAEIDMRNALIKFIGPVTIKGIGPGEVVAVDGASDKVELWTAGGLPRLFLKIDSTNFVNIGEVLFTVRLGKDLLEIERRKA